MDYLDENIDLSTFTYLEFLAFFFDRPLDKEIAFEMYHPLGRQFEVAQPALVIEHLTRMCSQFSEVAQRYTPEQIEQGLWALWGTEIDCGQYLFSLSVSPQARVACIESMYHVFRDVAVHQQGDERSNFYWIWWDMILHTVGLRKQPHDYRFGHASITPDQERIIDAIFATLSRILDLDHKGCQWSALHGMGHLYHPGVHVRTQEYLDLHRSFLSEDEIRWIDAGVRQNRIM